MSSRCARVLLSLLFATAFALPAAAKSKPQPCPDVRLLLTAGGAAVASPADTPVLLVFHAGRLSLTGACSPTSARAKPGKKGSKLTVVWKTCNGLKNVRLVGRTSPSCDTATGTLTAKRRPKTAVNAATSHCGDGTIDAGGGEQCDTTACTGGATCSGTCTCEPAANAQVTAHVTDRDGPAAGVQVTTVGGGPSGSTDANGRVTLTLMNGVPHTLKLTKAGFADVFHVVNFPLGTATGFFDRSLMPRDPAQQLDAAAGGTVTGRDGARLVLPANALVDGNGQPVTGTVDITQTPLDVSGEHLSEFPGDFIGHGSGGATNPIATYGTVEYAIEKNGQRLQLAPGKTATIQMPVYTTKRLNGAAVTAGQTEAFWWLDETTGEWTQEGTGTFVTSANSPTGLALEATVPHFSWWNIDTFIIPPDPFKPKTKCYIDSGAGILIETECSLGPQPYGVQEVPANARRAGTPQPSVAGFNRPPNYAVRAFVPIGGYTALLPANVDVVLRACNLLGTRCASKVLNGASNATDEIQFVLVPIDTGGNGDPITAPWKQDYAIDPAGQVDTFTFDGQAGETYAVSVTRAATAFLGGTVSVAVTGGATLDGEQFEQAPGAVTVTLPQTGNYTISVDGTSHEPGGYTLRLAKLTPDAEEAAGAAPFSVSNLFLQAPTHFRRYVLTATQGQIYGAQLQPTLGSYAGSGTLRAHLRNGTELGRTVLGPSRGPTLVFTAPANGDVLLDIAGQQAFVQTYDLNVYPLTAGTDEVVSLPFTRTDQLTEAIHTYRVTADAPRTLRTILDGNLAPFMTVLKDGKTLDTSLYYGSGSSPMTTTLPAAGEYLVAVHCGFGCGLPLPSRMLHLGFAPELTIGTPATGSIGSANEVSSFTFNANADKPYWVHAYSDTTADALFHQVTDFVGQDVSDFSQTVQPGVVTTAGRYTIDVRRASSGTGPFTVSAVAIDPPTPVAFSGNVATVTSALTIPGEQKYYTVELTAGDHVTLAIDTPVPNGAPGLGGSAALLKPVSGERFWAPQLSGGTARTNFGGTAANSGHAETNQYTVQQTGTHVIGIFHEGNWLANATGAFTWTLTKQ